MLRGRPQAHRATSLGTESCLQRYLPESQTRPTPSQRPSPPSPSALRAQRTLPARADARTSSREEVSGSAAAAAARHRSGAGRGERTRGGAVWAGRASAAGKVVSARAEWALRSLGFATSANRVSSKHREQSLVSMCRSMGTLPRLFLLLRNSLLWRKGLPQVYALIKTPDPHPGPSLIPLGSFQPWLHSITREREREENNNKQTNKPPYRAAF